MKQLPSSNEAGSKLVLNQRNFALVSQALEVAVGKFKNEKCICSLFKRNLPASNKSTFLLRQRRDCANFGLAFGDNTSLLKISFLKLNLRKFC